MEREVSYNCSFRIRLLLSLSIYMQHLHRFILSTPLTNRLHRMMAFAVFAGRSARRKHTKTAGPHAPRMGGDAGPIRNRLMSFQDKRTMQRNVCTLLLITATT